MRKNLYVVFMFTVMLTLCAARWTARADIAPIGLFVRDEPSADFSLVNADNALELTITPFTSGDYRYSFAFVNGDTEIVEEYDDDYFSYGASHDFKVSFEYDIPDAGEVIRYAVSASFWPGTSPRPEPEPVSDDNRVTESDDNPVIVSDDNRVTESDDNRVTVSDDNRVTESDDNRATVSDDNGAAASDDNRVTVSDDNRTTTPGSNNPSTPDSSSTTSQDNTRSTTSTDNQASAGGGSSGGCSLYDDDDDYASQEYPRINYVPAFYSATVEIRNVNGAVSVNIYEQ